MSMKWFYDTTSRISPSHFSPPIYLSNLWEFILPILVKVIRDVSRANLH